MPNSWRTLWIFISKSRVQAITHAKHCYSLFKYMKSSCIMLIIVNDLLSMNCTQCYVACAHSHSFTHSIFVSISLSCKFCNSTENIISIQRESQLRYTGVCIKHFASILKIHDKFQTETNTFVLSAQLAYPCWQHLHIFIIQEQQCTHKTGISANEYDQGSLPVFHIQCPIIRRNKFHLAFGKKPDTIFAISDFSKGLRCI